MTNNILGMLYIVEVRLVSKKSHEKIKEKLLLVGSEYDDIEKKLSWIYDKDKYDQFSISNICKVRQKIHLLNRTITSLDEPDVPNIKRDDNTYKASEASCYNEKYDPNLYAIGLSTSTLAKDENHALRKIGNALLAKGGHVQSGCGSLSNDSILTIEQIPLNSGYAMPRDVKNEALKASIVRGGKASPK